LTTRVVVADDHAVVREGTVELLGRSDGIEVVGEAADGLEALNLVAELRPDVLVLDLSMPGLDGLGVIERVHAASPVTAVLVLTAHDELPYVRAALEAGARGYLTKASRGAEVVEGVRATAAGQTVLSPQLTGVLLERPEPKAGSTQITPRELEVLAAAARGLGNKQIAAELRLSPRTVQTHLTSVFAKLGVGSRTEAVLRAMQEGWVSTPKRG
jgi:DNA-binding NarL/FixJ family response regulator